MAYLNENLFVGTLALDGRVLKILARPFIGPSVHLKAVLLGLGSLVFIKIWDNEASSELKKELLP